MKRLVGWHGATIRVEFAYRDGENLSAKGVGNLFEVQETYGGGRLARLAEFSIDQSLAQGRVDVKLGRIFAGADFAFSPLFCAFQNNAICGHPNSIPYNTGISLYPVASWGARIEVKPVKSLYVRTGVFEVNPSLNNKNGFDWTTHGATGEFVPVEIGLATHFGTGLDGLFRVGSYYDTSNTPDGFLDRNGHSRALSGLPALERNGRWGIYALAEQIVWAGRRGRNLAAFAGITRSDRATGYFDTFLEAGLVKKGTFKSRNGDSVAIGVAHGYVSPVRAAYERDARLPIETEETLIEANYGLQLRPWLSLRPNAQYVIRPGGTGRVPDATVLGLQLAVTL